MKNDIKTFISLEDFKKLNPMGYWLKKQYYDRDTDELVTDEELKRQEQEHLLPNGNVDLNFIAERAHKLYAKKEWVKVPIINDVVSSMADTKDGNYVVVAIAKDVTEEEIDKEYQRKKDIGAMYTREEVENALRLNSCYLGHFNTKTYQVYFDIDKLYSIRNYYEYCTDDYFRIPKDITKVIYMIHK